MIDSIIVMVGGRGFQQTVSIDMGTDLFLYSYKADFIQGILKKNKKKIAQSINLTFHYINEVFSLNHCMFS
jgi:hypothetical protein